MISKSEFKDWKASRVTQALFKDLRERVQGLSDELSYGAGLDPTGDRYKAGAIQALRDVLDTQYEGDEE